MSDSQTQSNSNINNRNRRAFPSAPTLPGNAEQFKAGGQEGLISDNYKRLDAELEKHSAMLERHATTGKQLADEFTNYMKVVRKEIEKLDNDKIKLVEEMNSLKQELQNSRDENATLKSRMEN